MYEGECMVVILRIKLLMKELMVRLVMIGIDSQAVIKAVTKTRTVPGHYLLYVLH